MHTTSRTQIITTLGPASGSKEVVSAMAKSGMDVVRLNMSWGTYEEHALMISETRFSAEALSKTIPIIMDLSGPRVQESGGHHFSATRGVLTEKDKNDIVFGAKHNVAYFALSYVGGPDDMELLREELKAVGSTARIIAKIERAEAVAVCSAIAAVSDAVMIARGDLGNEVPLEKIPFIERVLIEQAHAAGRPVIVATEMMSSMIEHERPSRADVTDVTFAVMSGADAVMLSNETAVGKHPIETVRMMERILLEAEAHGLSTDLRTL